MPLSRAVLGQLPALQSIEPGGNGNGTLTANAIFTRRFRLAKPVLVATATYFCAAAAGNVDLGCYQSDGTTLTKIANTGSTAAAGTNAAQAIALAASVLLPAGVDLYFYFATDSATLSLFRGNFAVSGGSAIGLTGSLNLSKTTSFPAPSTITISGMSGGNLMPWMVLS